MQVQAQGSAKALVAELQSGDSTRCMNAGNATSEHQEHYQQLAAELAAPLFDVLEKGPCSGSALIALVNVGPGIAEGIDAGRAIPLLVTVVEDGLSKGDRESLSTASSAVSVIGHFGAAGAPAVPILARWVLEGDDSFDQRVGLGALAKVGDAAAPVVPALLPLLTPPAEDDEDAWQKNDLRNEVARMLGSVPSASARSAPLLVAGLRDEDYGFRYAAGESIAMLGAPMVPHLVAALETSDAEAKQDLLRLIGGMGTAAADAAPAIAPLLADEDWSVSYEAGTTLREMGPTPAGVAAIAKVLAQEANEDAVLTAARVLAGYGSAAKDALPALRKAATSRNWSISNAAKEAISAIE